MESTVDDDSASEVLIPTPDDLLPGRAIHLPPITRRNLVGTPPNAHVLQHASVQTTPTHFNNQSIQTDTTLETLRLHEEQQTIPHPEPWSAATQTDSSTSHATVQTELHSIVLFPAVATPNQPVTPTTATTTTEPTSTPTATMAPPPFSATSLSNKQPNTDPAQWHYANYFFTAIVHTLPLLRVPLAQGKRCIF